MVILKLKTSNSTGNADRKVSKSSSEAINWGFSESKGVPEQVSNNTDARPRIKIKSQPSSHKIRIRRHEPGLGYDSEASDREDTPLLEEQCILRMKPGPDCDYLREAISKKSIGVDANVWLKLKDPRTGIISVNDNIYPFILVDLPCVIESHKTFDKKTIYKACDISQMIIVKDKLQDEESFKDFKPDLSQVTYPHGLTPPMKYVRARRFRKRVSNKTIEAVETEVDRLLSADAAGTSSTYEILDRKTLDTASARALFMAKDLKFEDDDKSGTESERRYRKDEEDEVAMDDFDLAGQIEQSMLEFDRDSMANLPDIPNIVDKSRNDDDDDEDDDLRSKTYDRDNRDTQTPAPADDEDDDEDEDEEEDDEDKREKHQNAKLLKARILELEAAIHKKKNEAEKIANPILKSRLIDDIKKLSAELEMKQIQNEEIFPDKPE